MMWPMLVKAGIVGAFVAGVGLISITAFSLTDPNHVAIATGAVTGILVAVIAK